MPESLLNALLTALALFWLWYIFLANLDQYRARFSPEWQDYKNPWWREVTLIDGHRKRGGHLMRRHMKGQFQYRERSAAEISEHEDAIAW